MYKRQAAVDFLHRDMVGCMAALKGQEIVCVSLGEVAGKTHGVPPELYEAGQRFFRLVTALETPATHP